jgi:hypothetical protein
MNEEQRRLTFLRENVESLAEEKNTLESFLWHLRSSNEHESLEILRRLRSGSDPQTLVQQIQASRSLTQVKGDTESFTQGLHTGSASSCQYPDTQSLLVNKFLQYDPFLDFPRLNMQSPAAAHERIIHAIATSSVSDTDEIVQRLRRREPVERIIETIDSSHYSRSSSAMDLDPTPTDPGQIPTYQARPMAGNALAPELVSQRTTGSTRAPDAHTPPNAEGYRWTNVTKDRELIEHLLDIYFMWQHSFFQNFPEFLFRQDYEAGKTKYCSRVLVNAICAAGCLLSDRPEARGDPYDTATAGTGFFEEGMLLLNRADKSSIPSTAGVFLLSHVEGYRAHLGAMWGLVGRSARMALDLNLHLRNEKVPFDEMPPTMQTEENGRIHTFWGCFISDQYVISPSHQDSPD